MIVQHVHVSVDIGTGSVMAWLSVVLYRYFESTCTGTGCIIDTSYQYAICHKICPFLRYRYTCTLEYVHVYPYRYRGTGITVNSVDSRKFYRSHAHGCM